MRKETLSSARAPTRAHRLALGDCLGRPYRAWDPRGYAQLKKYDPIQRLTQVLVTPPGATQFLAEQIVYGEGLTVPNFRGRIYQHFDGAGVLTGAAYDFEGRITHTTRQLAINYQTTPSWSVLASLSDPTSFLPAAAGLLETDIFDTWSTFDAMGRILTETLHDLTVIVPTYNAATLLASVQAYMQGATTATPIVTNVDYNARGQRIAVNYGKGVQAAYTYDDRTRMVMRIQTTRQSDSAALQDLNYTYDPVHNVVQITDLAQQTVYFSGTVTSGTQLFEYDPIYRITKATGREQPGQVGYSIAPNGYPDAPFANIPDPQNLQALLPYTEIYSYDAVGNIQTTVHKASTAGWTRTQTYVTGTNRIDTVSMPRDPSNGPYSGLYKQDAAGNIDVTPNLSTITWDQDDRLIGADLQGGGMAYFTYNSLGDRVRKIVQRSGQILERVYIGGYERYRVLSGASMACSTVSLERGTAHIHGGQRRFAIIETEIIQNVAQTPLFRLQFPNHIGSACLETDISGTPISYEEYYPFGGSSYRAGDNTKRYRFCGKERDEETGLYYHGMRYFMPWLSRWASPDPLGNIDGPNSYTYARNRPTTLIDPAGMSSQQSEDSDITSPPIGVTPEAIVRDVSAVTDVSAEPAETVTGPTQSDDDADEDSGPFSEWLEDFLEHLHLTLEGVEFGITPATKAGGEVFAHLVETTHETLWSASLRSRSIIPFGAVRPPGLGVVSEGLKDALPKLADLFEIAGEIAPYIQGAVAVLKEQQSFVELTERKYTSFALDAAQSATLWWAFGRTLILGASAATSFSAWGIGVGLDAIKAAVEGTEQPVDKFDRLVEQYTGFNPKLGDLGSYWSGNTTVRFDNRFKY